MADKVYFIFCSKPTFGVEVPDIERIVESTKCSTCGSPLKLETIENINIVRCSYTALQRYYEDDC